MNDEIRTGGGASTGDIDTGGGDVTGRDQANVTVNVQQAGPPYYPDYHTSQPGGLSVSEATRLDADIRAIRELLQKVTVDLAVLASKKSERDRDFDEINLQVANILGRLLELEKRADRMMERVAKRDPFQIAFGVLVIAFMAIIAGAVIVNGGL